MIIPNSRILLLTALGGSLITAISGYWIGRRDELDQLINLGQQDGGFLMKAKLYGRHPYELFLRSEGVKK